MNDFHQHSRFFIDRVNTASGYFLVGGSEIQHIRVKRLEKGGNIIGLDGKGVEYYGEVEATHRDEVICRILEVKKHPQPRCKINLCLSVLKPGPMSMAVEKAVELGVWGIIPIKAERSQRRLYANEAGRLQRIALAAMKQSGQVFLPKVSVSMSLAEFLAMPKGTHRLLYADAQGEGILQANRIANKIFLCIGPEGGFSEAEIEALQENEGTPVSLGRRRLRSETAAMTALAVLQLKNSEKI